MRAELRDRYELSAVELLDELPYKDVALNDISLWSKLNPGETYRVVGCAQQGPVASYRHT